MITSYMTEELERALDALATAWNGAHTPLETREAALAVVACWRKVERHMPRAGYHIGNAFVTPGICTMCNGPIDENEACRCP